MRLLSLTSTAALLLAAAACSSDSGSSEGIAIARGPLALDVPGR